jgi:ribose/xylose/arabinose/galactoside ABC-type transport system permease subunit
MTTHPPAPPCVPPSRSILAHLSHHPSLWPALALFILLLTASLAEPSFAHIHFQNSRLYGHIIDILRNGSIVMLLATGMTLVIATAGIDLSVGSVMAIAGALAALLITEHHTSASLAITLALAAGLLLGLWNGALVAFLNLQPIIATLVLLVAGRGLAQTLTSDQKLPLSTPLLDALAHGAILGLPAPLWLAAALAAITAAALRYTILGMAIEAVGGNSRAAALCGLRVSGTRLLVYGFSGICAAFAGLIAAADIGQADVTASGVNLELDAILAVVIGGTSLRGGRPNIFGSLMGAALMQTLTVLLIMRGIITEYTLIVKAAVAVIVCAAHSPVLADQARRFLSRRSAAP